MKNTSFEKFCSARELKLTSLRKDILSILYDAHQPMGAYEILEILREKRDGSEPPTVYRVLKWLVDAELIHRIESQNAYVCCSTVTAEKITHKAILLLCRNCNKSYEFEDSGISLAVRKFGGKNKVEVDDTLIEVKGLCSKCLNKASRI